MKFSKSFYACLPGEVYPTRFAVGDECPKALEAAALRAKALEAPRTTRKVKADADTDDE